jgi:hypothetical protein
LIPFRRGSGQRHTPLGSSIWRVGSMALCLEVHVSAIDSAFLTQLPPVKQRP